MAYIGIQPAEKFTSFATQEFSTSATTSYTLDHAVANENELALFVNNVRQQPGSGKAYTATGTALTLSAATASTDTMYCVFLGRALQTVVPATNSITAAMVGNDLISGKDALTSSPADTDELLISDAGVLKRIDVSLVGGKNTPSFRVRLASDQGSVANETQTKVAFDTEDWDTDSAFASNKFTVPSGQGGKYCFISRVGIDNIDDGEFIASYYYKNGSIENKSYDQQWVSKGTNGFGYTNNVYVVALAAGDYIELYAAHNEGGTQSIESDYTFMSGFKLVGV